MAVFTLTKRGSGQVRSELMVRLADQ